MKIYYNDNNLILLVYCIGTRHISAEIPNHRENMFTDVAFHRFRFFNKNKNANIGFNKLQKDKSHFIPFITIARDKCNIDQNKTKKW